MYFPKRWRDGKGKFPLRGLFIQYAYPQLHKRVSRHGAAAIKGGNLSVEFDFGKMK